MRLPRALLLSVVCLGTLAAPSWVEAQSAAELFAQGQQALGAGKNAEAARAFETCYALEARSDALLMLGLAQTGMGRPDLAERSYEAYLAAADPARDAAQLEAVRGELVRLREVNAQVELRVRPDTAHIRIDGALQQPRDGRLLVTPGLRRFQLEAPGYTTHERRMRVEPGRFVLEVALEPLVTAAATPTVVEPAPPPSSAAAAVPAATGAAAAAAGAPAPAAPAPPPAPPAATPVLAAGEPAAAIAAGAAAEPAPAAAEPGPPAEDDGACAGGDFCFGPVLTLGVLNFFGGGLHARYDWFGFGIDAQFVPPISVGGGKVSAWLISVPVRAYLAGPFYVSVGFAYQSIFGAMTDASGKVTASVRVPALTLGVGLLGRKGLVFGIDAQLGIPLGPDHTSVTAPAGAPPEVVDEAEDLAKDVADALPVILQLNLLRLGYLF